MDPGGNDPLSDDYVTIKDNLGNRFYDSFDFSGIDYESIDKFSLTLDFSATGDSWGGFFKENWNVRPAISPLNATQHLFPLTRSDGRVSQTFEFDIVNLDIFNTIVEQKSFDLWFAEQSRRTNQFNLYSARLDIQGTPQPQNPVPEPSTMLLLSLGLLGVTSLGKKNLRKFYRVPKA